MKLWIVYSGNFGDAPYVHGVFDSKELAEAAVLFAKLRQREYHDSVELHLSINQFDGTGVRL